jgi:hypothetical protein
MCYFVSLGIVIVMYVVNLIVMYVLILTVIALRVERHWKKLS